MQDRIDDLRRRRMPWKSSRTNTDTDRDTCEDQDQDQAGSRIGDRRVLGLFPPSIFDFPRLQGVCSAVQRGAGAVRGAGVCGASGASELWLA